MPSEPQAKQSSSPCPALYAPCDRRWRRFRPCPGQFIKGIDEKKAAGERLLLARQEMPNADMMLLGTYRGFELNIRFDSFKNEHQAVLRAELSYPVSLSDDARGNIIRLDNAIDNFADRIADAENALQNLEQQKQAAEIEVAKPFAPLMSRKERWPR